MSSIPRTTLSLLGAIAAIAALAEAAPPHISPVFPAAEDIRSPDSTIDRASVGPAAVVAYDLTGRVFATAGSDNVIRVWDARTGEQDDGKLLSAMIGHSGRIRALAFLKDDSVVSVSEDQTVRTWKFPSGESIRRIPLGIGADSASVVFCPGETPLLAESAGPKVRLWNYATAKVERELAPLAPARFLAFAPDGKFLITAADQGAVQVWDLKTGEPRSLPGPRRPVQSLAVSAGLVALGCADGSILWLPIQVGPPIRDFSSGSVGPVAVVAFSTKGDQFAAAGADRTIKVWDVPTGSLLCSQEGAATPIVSVAFNSNGQKMASGEAGGAVDYWTVPLPPIPPGDLEKIMAALPGRATVQPRKPRRLLVFWRADAILHKGGVPAANHAIEMMAAKTGAFAADFTRDYGALDPAVLKNYDAIVMNSTAHIAIPEKAKKAYLDYARGGGGVIGIHAAIDMFSRWPEGAAVIGATFANHPWHPDGTWAVKLEEPGHPLLRAWDGKNFRMHDELYEMGPPYTRADRRVLLTVDMSDPVTAGVAGLHRQDRDFALSWIKRYGKGRVFYCDFGHLGEPFQNPAVLRYYLDGIQYALGDLDVDDSPKAR